MPARPQSNAHGLTFLVSWLAVCTRIPCLSFCFQIYNSTDAFTSDISVLQTRHETQSSVVFPSRVCVIDMSPFRQAERRILALQPRPVRSSQTLHGSTMYVNDDRHQASCTLPCRLPSQDLAVAVFVVLFFVRVLWRAGGTLGVI